MTPLAVTANATRKFHLRSELNTLSSDVLAGLDAAIAGTQRSQAALSKLAARSRFDAFTTPLCVLPEDARTRRAADPCGGVEPRRMARARLLDMCRMGASACM